MVNSWILAWCNALRDNSRVNREVNSNLRVEQPALKDLEIIIFRMLWYKIIILVGDAYGLNSFLCVL